MKKILSIALIIGYFSEILAQATPPPFPPPPHGVPIDTNISLLILGGVITILLSYKVLTGKNKKRARA